MLLSILVLNILNQFRGWGLIIFMTDFLLDYHIVSVLLVHRRDGDVLRIFLNYQVLNVSC